MPLFLVEVCACVCAPEREWMNDLVCPFTTCNRNQQRAALGPPFVPLQGIKGKTKACVVLKIPLYRNSYLKYLKSLHKNTPQKIFFLLNYRLCYAFYLSFLLVLHIQTAFFSFTLLLKYFTSVSLTSKSTAHTPPKHYIFAWWILVKVVR